MKVELELDETVTQEKAEAFLDHVISLLRAAGYLVKRATIKEEKKKNPRRPPKESKDKFDPRDVAILGGDPSL